MLLICVIVSARVILSWRRRGLMQVRQKWRSVNVKSWHLYMQSRLTVWATGL